MDSQVPVADRRDDEGDLSRLLNELRHWHVFRVAAAYAVVSWLVVQVAATVGPAFDMPNWVLRAIVLAAIVGFLATMAVLLFRPRTVGKGRMPIYLSRRARLLAGAAVLLIAAAAAAVSIRMLGAKEQVSLAVLPFADFSPARDKTYFAEGVGEEILSALAAEKGIKVLGRTSARHIDRNPDPAAIRASLGVTHLLEGSTRTDGKSLRVNVRLIDTADGSQLWEEEYNGGISDVFQVQDRIASAVVRRLRGTFFGGSVRGGNPTSIDAYEAYLAARALIRENKREAIERSWRMARQMVQTHPDYAPGHAIYAETTMLLSDSALSYGTIPLAKARAVALAHARESIRLAPNRAEGYAALGLAVPVSQSIASYRKAIALDPSRSDVRLRLAIALDVLQRHDEAFDQYRIAYEMEPLAPAVINRYIQILGASGQHREALQVIDRFVERGGSPAQGWRFRGAVLAYGGDLSLSIAARRRALQLDPGLPYQHEWLAIVLKHLGLDDQAASYATDLPPYIASFVRDDRGSLKAQLVQQGAGAWTANGVDFAIFSLARARDWSTLVRFYDLRPSEIGDLCTIGTPVAPVFVRALQEQGRSRDASRLAGCAQQQLRRLVGMRFRSPDGVPANLEFIQASLLALRGDRRALDQLDRAVQLGWTGQYYSTALTDWPQFDALRAEARYLAIQTRIDTMIERERRETLAGN